MIDSAQRAFGYENLLICDGSAVPANPGVNPSLTIAALAERHGRHPKAVMIVRKHKQDNAGHAAENSDVVD